MRGIVLGCWLAIMGWSGIASAGDAYYDVPVAGLRLPDGPLPTDAGETWRHIALWPVVSPRVLLDGPGEAYVTGVWSAWNWTSELAAARLRARVPEGQPLRGRLLLPARDLYGQVVLRFEADAGQASAGARVPFHQAREAWFRGLMAEGFPGAAWFREQADESLRQQGGRPPDAAGFPAAPVPTFESELDETLGLFSGGRALAENLQLDRLLAALPAEAETVDVDTLPGIEVEAIDWEPRLQGKSPEVDPLADRIPADQYALFFRSFRDMTRLADEADAVGTPVLDWLSPAAEDSRSKDRYPAQLGLPLSLATRLVGPHVVRTAALTGSDPFLRMGSDLALLLETDHAGIVMGWVLVRQALALHTVPAAQRAVGFAGGTMWLGVASPDRRISSYLAKKRGVVVVSNSRPQLERILRTASGSDPSLARTGEYRFFRDRYSRTDGEEGALLVVPDEAIRRWGGPRWRILDSRRTRAAAVLAALQARHADELAAGVPEERRLEVPASAADLGEVRLTRAGVRSSVYGTLAFLTPIAELPLSLVTRAEADAYERFRNLYQSNWWRYFDPIAIRFLVRSSRVVVDLSVLPLIAGTDYRELIELTRGVDLSARAGDPHDAALVRMGVALNRESGVFREAGSWAAAFAPDLAASALSWLGDHAIVYADRDPFWEELAAAPDHGEYLAKNLHRLPVALHVAVGSAMKVTAFLASLRVFVDQAAPGMTLWETRRRGEAAYVRVAPKEPIDRDLSKDLALYYAVTPQCLLVTLSEPLLLAALDRLAAAAATAEQGMPWLGRQAGLQVQGDVLRLLDPLLRDGERDRMQRLAWASLPILNEWHRRWPDRDPVAMHEALWGVRLRCPAGGGYAWNEAWQMMESTEYGHPAAPKPGPGLLRPPLDRVTAANFGVSFEDDGLRARAEVTRRPKTEAQRTGAQREGR
ncbi:MAG: hypothetical protein FJ098_05075 [Deltaproteobacteria bacterium]|nr:hypothetical protein [Deltaproteobacteria bacterium]